MRIPLAPRSLSRADVVACLPPMPRQLELAERALRALATDAQLPAKIGIEPRPHASWAHAMPAWVPGDATDGSGDLMGIKWVSGFPANAARGIPALHATLLLSEATSGALLGVIDAGVLTAYRTAAISGVAIARWGPGASGTPRVGLIGAGVQAESHLAMLATVLPGCEVRITDRDPQRAIDLATRAAQMGGFADVRPVETPAAALADADVALTLVSFGPERQGLDADLFASIPLVVAVDYDMCVPAVVARDATFLVDETGQLLANRASGIFQGYPDPTGIMGAWLDSPRPDGPMLVTHLGTGVADLVFGDAVLRAATARGLGTLLAD